MTAPSETAETLEANIRHLMFQHASITPRGWDTISERARLHQTIDDLLDWWTEVSVEVDTAGCEAS